MPSFVEFSRTVSKLWSGRECSTADGWTDGQTDGRTDGRTDTQKFGGYNIIPLFVAGHKKYMVLVLRKLSYHACLIILYIGTKFHENISKGFGVIARTRNHDRRTDVFTNGHLLGTSFVQSIQQSPQKYPTITYGIKGIYCFYCSEVPNLCPLVCSDRQMDGQTDKVITLGLRRLRLAGP